MHFYEALKYTVTAGPTFVRHGDNGIYTWSCTIAERGDHKDMMTIPDGRRAITASVYITEICATQYTEACKFLSACMIWICRFRLHAYSK